MTESRNFLEIRTDTLCGKMAEVAVAKILREDYGQHIQVNYEIYPRGDWDDEDIVINGRTVDVKATQNPKSHCLLLEKNKVDFRARQGKLPHMIVMCRTDLEHRRVSVVGCISTAKLINPNNPKVKRLRCGECIPGTSRPLQADNYCVEFDDLNSVNVAFDYILKHDVAS